MGTVNALYKNHALISKCVHMSMTFDRGLRMLNRARVVGRYVSHEQVAQQHQVSLFINAKVHKMQCQRSVKYVVVCSTRAAG